MQDIANFIELIESGRLELSYKTNRQHVKHVREIIEENLDIKSCSQCGAEMVIRKPEKVIMRVMSFGM